MDNEQIIKTLDEDGNEVELKLLDIVTVEGIDYALLLPADEDEDEDSEVVLMKMTKQNDEYLFETIEDDKEFEAVAKAISDDDFCDDENCECHHH